MKAFKAGEDPNQTNPAPKKEEEPELVDDPNVQEFDESVANASKSRQASIEEVPDESDRLGRDLAQTSTLSESLHPSRTSSVPRPPATPDIPSVPRNAPGASLQADEDPSQAGDFKLPDTPANIGSGLNLPDTPTAFQSFPPPSTQPSAPTPDSFYNVPARTPTPPPAAPSFVPSPAAHAPTPTAPYVPTQPSHGVDDNSVQLAQKHARWAVSALTFDDVDTAIKELRNSLKYLGAT